MELEYKYGGMQRQSDKWRSYTSIISLYQAYLLKKVQHQEKQGAYKNCMRW